MLVINLWSIKANQIKGKIDGLREKHGLNCNHISDRRGSFLYLFGIYGTVHGKQV